MRTAGFYGNAGRPAYVLSASLALILCACSVNDGPSSGETEGAATGEGEISESTANGGSARMRGGNVANDLPPPPPPFDPVEMAETAWAANDPDGVVYTTFIDPDGGYRDFRDGEKYQIGSWDMPGSNRLCYRPDNAAAGTGEDERGRTCWTVRPPGRDGVMIAVNSDGRKVTVRRVEYVVPEGE